MEHPTISLNELLKGLYIEERENEPNFKKEGFSSQNSSYENYAKEKTKYLKQLLNKMGKDLNDFKRENGRFYIPTITAEIMKVYLKYTGLGQFTSNIKNNKLHKIDDKMRLEFKKEIVERLKKIHAENPNYLLADDPNVTPFEEQIEVVVNMIEYEYEREVLIKNNRQDTITSITNAISDFIGDYFQTNEWSGLLSINTDVGQSFQEREDYHLENQMSNISGSVDGLGSIEKFQLSFLKDDVDIIIDYVKERLILEVESALKDISQIILAMAEIKYECVLDEDEVLEGYDLLNEAIHYVRDRNKEEKIPMSPLPEDLLEIINQKLNKDL